MILCLDVGNSQIHGGVFDSNNLVAQFRKTSKTGFSSDEVGLFLRAVLRENGVEPDSIQKISLCSVVPEVVHSLKSCCIKYFKLNPFILQAGVKTGLNIRYKNPTEVGSDRIANAIAATHLYPQKNLIVIDFGTATTFCAINRNKEYLGGSILAGIKISMEVLESKTSKLPSVEIVVPKRCVGNNTTESIQSGLYYGTIGVIKEISSRIKSEVFHSEEAMIVATGGLSSLLKKEGLFDAEVPDLALKGLYLSLMLNT